MLVAGALAAGAVATACHDTIERGPGLVGRELPPLPLPSNLARIAEATVLTRTAEAQAPAPRPEAGGAPASAATRLGLGPPPPRPTTVPGFSGTVDEMLRELEQGEPRVLMPLGAGSSVLRMRFGSALAAVLRPKTRGQPDGALAEVAAYRIAAALGIDVVPPAALRKLPPDDMRRRFSGTPDEWDAIRRTFATEADGQVLGAAIAYETDLRSLGLEQPRKRAEWEGWLAQGAEIPEASRAMARDLARMMVFDYLIANRERFDDPLRGSPDGTRVLLRNHDTAFPSPVTDAVERRLRGELRKTERFSRSMIAGLAALDRAALEALVRADAGPLLDPARVDGVLERRDTILSYVEALADRYGADQVFAFD